MATVTFDHVTKAYPDGTVAVSDLDLLIKDG
jgi:ABC-type ATPase involved in cell division